MNTAGQGTQGEDINEDKQREDYIQDKVNQVLYSALDHKRKSKEDDKKDIKDDNSKSDINKQREDSNELEKDTESEDTDIADNDRSEDTDEYGGSDDTDIAVHITVSEKKDKHWAAMITQIWNNTRLRKLN